MYSEFDRADLRFSHPKHAQTFIQWFRALKETDKRIDNVSLRVLLNKSPKSTRRDGAAYQAYQFASEVFATEVNLIWGINKIMGIPMRP